MGTSSPTQLIVYLDPSNEEHALYLIGESFTATTITVVGKQEEQITWGDLFRLTRKEQRLTLELSGPLMVEQIKDIANLVTIGLIRGFVTRGEIDLGGRVINNLE